MTAADLQQSALAALAEGRLDEARQGFEQVLAGDPDNAVALHWSAAIAYQQGTAPDAAQDRTSSPGRDICMSGPAHEAQLTRFGFPGSAASGRRR